MNFFEELEWRGLIKDCTDRDGLRNKLNNESVTCYCGIDPTADSLHIGHLQQLILLKRYQNAGHRVIAVCGGATGMIGDPRPTTERSLLSLEQVKHNVEAIKQQVSRFVDFSDGKALLVNNYDWLSKLSLLQFLRDYGKYFNVSYMINKETIAKRLSSGISFTEFTYTILQAIDWLTLYKEYNCTVQFGGSDQWGNIVSGADLIKKVMGDNSSVFAVTSPLITKSDGSKFGKSEGENVWLDENRTSPYDFYQFIINVSDSDIINFLKRFSFKSREEIEALEKDLNERPEERNAQKALASELCEMVFGKKGLDSALKITNTLFSGNFKELSAKEIKQGLKDAKSFEISKNMNIVDILNDTQIAKSKREARELVNGGSISINGDKITDVNQIIDKGFAIEDSLIVLRKGKKNYFILYLK